MKYEIIINKYGDKLYYVNNVLHREEGPALEFADGTKYWYKNGLIHRENGPAIKYFNGNTRWYLNSIYYSRNDDFTNKSWKSFVKTLIFS